MNNPEDDRIDLLRSLVEAVSLFQTLQVELKENKKLEPEFCTNLESEIVRLTAVVQSFQTAAGIVPTEVSSKKVLSRLKEAPPGSRKPDYVFWSRLAHWTEYDAVALAAGCDPELVEWTESNRLLEWVRAAVEQGALKAPISPAGFMQWVDRLGDEGVTLPEELRQAIVKHQSIDFGSSGGERRNETHAPEAERPGYDLDALAEGMEHADHRLTASPRTFRTTQRLLAYFLDRAGIVDLGGEGKLALTHAQAEEIGAGVGLPAISDKTVLRHLKQAVLTARGPLGKNVTRRN